MYQMFLIKVVTVSAFLRTRIDMQNLYYDVFDISSDANGLKNDPDNDGVYKWDITNTTTVTTWENSRCISLEVNSDDVIKSENQYIFMAAYIAFVLVYLIGVSDPHFYYVINLPFL